MIFKFIRSKHIYFKTRMIACGILAVGCGLDGDEKMQMSKGYVAKCFKWMWTVEEDKEKES